MPYKLTTKTCANCKTFFPAKEPQINYCSRACSSQARRRTPESRFWAKVDVTPSCWLWTGAKNRDGYGSFGIRGTETILAHRFAFLLAHGHLPDDLEVCHHCDNPSCVRPAHLFLGTHADNMRDSSDKGRAKARAARGERNGGNKHPESVIREVLALAGTMSQDLISTRTGISQTHVSRIIRGINWRCLA